MRTTEFVGDDEGMRRHPSSTPRFFFRRRRFVFFVSSVFLFFTFGWLLFYLFIYLSIAAPVKSTTPRLAAQRKKYTIVMVTMVMMAILISYDGVVRGDDS